MNIVIAPQALKGSLSAAEAGQAIAEGVRAVYPEARLSIVPVADGGEGTVQALVDATGGEMIRERVTGPLGTPVEAFYGLLGDGQTAAIEMAACAGLPLVPPEQRDPRITTTYGVGELIRAALEHGCRHFILGIGGSATNDGGAGMAQALGALLLDAKGAEIDRGGGALAVLERISVEELDSRLCECRFEVACDVTNPLCGPSGATAIYGPQKGATPEMIPELDAALAHYASVIERDLGLAVANSAGAGAAGGLGAGMMAFLVQYPQISSGGTADRKKRPVSVIPQPASQPGLVYQGKSKMSSNFAPGAILRSGANIVLETVQLEKYMREAQLVITAEGQLDAQTAYGKSVGAVAHLAKRYGVPVLALAGSLGERYQTLYHLGIDGIITLPSGPMPLTQAMEQAASLASQATERAMRILKLGGTLQPR